MGTKHNDRGGPAVVEATLGCGRNFWESPSLGRVWRDVFWGGKRGRVNVFEMLVHRSEQGCRAQGPEK